MESYGHLSADIKREEGCTSLDELLSGSSGDSPQFSGVQVMPGPFPNMNSPQGKWSGVAKPVPPNVELPVSDMDLAGFLDMDDKTLSGNYQ